MTKKRLTAIVALTAVISMAVGGYAYAQLDKILKGGAIIALVDRVGPDINKALNKLTGDKNVPYDMATKVVPILTLGGGAYAGCVQVAGPDDRVEKVKAVAQIEQSFSFLGKVRVKALVPVETRSMTSIKRVPGVGVSALVDLKL
jgi:hypothetical protein